MYNNFLKELDRHNIPSPQKAIEDSKFTRWGKKSRYWAIFVNDGYIFGDHVIGLSANYFPRSDNQLSAEELIERTRKIKEAKEFAEKERFNN